MREGAWIQAVTGHYCWITEHASWIQVPENARRLGVPEDVHARIAAIRWDFNGKGREAILREAMGAGFIRVRGQGASTTFESRLPMEQAIRVASRFMAENLGPLMGCRFNNLDTGESWGAGFDLIAKALEAGTLPQLLEKR